MKFSPTQIQAAQRLLPGPGVGRVLAAVLAVAAGVAAVRLPAASDPTVELKNGIAAYEAKRYPAAIAALDRLGPRIPQLADYAAWYLASAYNETKNFAAVPAALEPVWRQIPASPFRDKAVLLASSALVASSQPQAAVELLRAHYSELPQPQGDLAMAEAAAAAGDGITAAIYCQRVYFGYPQSALAQRAQARDQALRVSLGADYPPSLPHAMLARATQLIGSGQNTAAIKEFEALVPLLGGAERDVARVRIGAARYNANQNAAAYEYLAALEVSDPEADAERLNYLSQAARRLDKLAEMEKLALRAAELYPHSRWTAESLIAAGNRYLLDHRVERYEPLYAACYQGLPGDPLTDLCHWKVTWTHYMRRDTDAASMLQEHLMLYPGSESASNALYFLGRLAEQIGDSGAARRYYEEAATEYPNVFYALLARDRLTRLRGARSSEPAAAFLRSVGFPERAHTREFRAGALVTARGERAQLLIQMGFKTLAEAEIRYGADSGEQPHLLAMELAKLVGAGNPAQALRYIKRYAKGYLLMPLESAPNEFWRMAFPLPYRDGLERYSKEQSLDPFLIAGLIRQESEFDAKVISYANARGLTQIEPATGREIGRRLKVPFSLPKLLEANYNIRFGTFYFKQNLDRLNGNVEATLASYNAGMTRAKAWLQWEDFREPAEFIETVPITQTRNYIQAVLRNAATYREVYGAGAGVPLKAAE